MSDMQEMNQFILPTPAAPTYVLEGAEQAPASPATSRSYSWSMESDPQLFTNDATFWQDVSTFICSSPQNSFDYRSEDFACSGTSPTSPDEQNFKVVEPENGASQPRVRGQTLELLLKRRAQNRASQRAYRDRRDQHVRELETQYEEMAKRNEELTREHEALCAAHEKLKVEREAWKAEQEAARASSSPSKDVSRFASGDDELHWRAEACLSQMLSAGGAGAGVAGGCERGGGEGEAGGGGSFGGLVVKVVVCKRCFGPQVKAKCEG